ELPFDWVAHQRPAVSVPLARFAPRSTKRPIVIEYKVGVPVDMLRDDRRRTGHDATPNPELALSGIMQRLILLSTINNCYNVAVKARSMGEGNGSINYSRSRDATSKTCLRGSAKRHKSRQRYRSSCDAGRDPDQ